MTKLLKAAIDFANSKGYCLKLNERIGYIADIISHIADRDERTEEIIAFRKLTDEKLMKG